MTTPNSDPQFQEALRKLERRLQSTVRKFGLVLARHDVVDAREQAIRELEQRGHRFGKLEVGVDDVEFGHFEARLEEVCAQWPAVHVFGVEHLAQEQLSAWLKGWNYHREHIAAHCPSLIVLWLFDSAVTTFAEEAPDAWAWRTTVVEFSIGDVESMGGTAPMQGWSGLSGAKARMRVLEDHIARVERGEAKENANLVARLKTELAELYLRVGRTRDAEALMEALSHTELDLDPIASLRLRVALARATGRTSDFLELVGEWLELPRTSRASHLRLGLHIMAVVAEEMGQVSEVIHALEVWLEDLSGTAEERDDVAGLLEVGALKARVLLLQSKPDKAAASLRQLLPGIRRLGQDALAIRALLDLGRADLELGAYERAVQDLMEAARLADEISEAGLNAQAKWMLARTRMLQGDLETARELLEEDVLPTSKRLGAEGQRADTIALLAEVYLRMCDPERAMDLIHDALDLRDKLSRLRGAWELLLLQAEANRMLHRLEHARRILSVILLDPHASGLPRRVVRQAEQLLAQLQSEAPHEHTGPAATGSVQPLPSTAREPTSTYTPTSEDDDSHQAG